MGKGWLLHLAMTWQWWCRRFLRASEELLRRVLRAQRNRDLARACSLSSGDGDDEDENEGPSGSGSPPRAPGASLSPTPNPLPDSEELPKLKHQRQILAKK